MEILVSTDFMERTVKMEIQALRVFRAIRENLVCRELLALQELMVRMAHRELVDRREVQDHLARLVPLVLIDYFKSSNFFLFKSSNFFFLISPFQCVLIFAGEPGLNGLPGSSGSPGQPGTPGVPGGR
jgi:hypothetical protein